MRLKHLKAQIGIPAAIISLILVLLVFYIMFATGNRFTEHLIDVMERMGWFGEILSAVAELKK